MTTVFHQTEPLQASWSTKQVTLPNLSCIHFNQPCSAKDKIVLAALLPHEAK